MSPATVSDPDDRPLVLAIVEQIANMVGHSSERLPLDVTEIAPGGRGLASHGRCRRWVRTLGQSVALRYNVPPMSTGSRNERIARQVDYWTLAELRYQIRRFLRIREDAARAAGIEPQQYQLLLQVKGMQGRQPSTIVSLAERLQLRHHSTVELVDRLEDRNMLVRRPGTQDRREVHVELRPSGEAILKRLALYSLNELKTEGPALVATLTRLVARSRAGKRAIAAPARRSVRTIRARRRS
jgi:DNA-binding MarR family transcriptional regulator